jgi:hypothetical protein
VIRVDREQLALKAAGEQVLIHDASERRGTAGCADDRD